MAKRWTEEDVLKIMALIRTMDVSSLSEPVSNDTEKDDTGSDEGNTEDEGTDKVESFVVTFKFKAFSITRNSTIRIIPPTNLFKKSLSF